MRWKNQDIPDQAILTYIENSPRFLAKVQRLLGQLTGGKTKLTADARSERARHAAQKRWEKPRKPKPGHCRIEE